MSTTILVAIILLISSPPVVPWSAHPSIRPAEAPSQKRFVPTLSCTRRDTLFSIVALTAPFLSSCPAFATGDTDHRRNYRYSKEWTGTSLSVMSPSDAADFAATSISTVFPFGQWPDPILRRPASPVPDSFSSSKLRALAHALRQTCRAKKAVGLAAQQCGIDARLVFLELPSNTEGLFLVNPRIVARSPEIDQVVWTEHCLVLPPSFSATVLRDDTVTIEYETLDRKRSQIKLQGELARAAQHEMDHDRGVLILDHVELEEMESNDMKRLESNGHEQRMELAFTRYVDAPYESSFKLALRPAPANAAVEQEAECDEACIAKRMQIIRERRAMMQQSRTTTKRQDMFDLSRQRAALYNTTYQGAACAPNVPCL